MKEPQISVGIIHSQPQVAFTLSDYYEATAKYCQGVVTQVSYVRDDHTVHYVPESGMMRWNGHDYDSLIFVPTTYSTASFELKDVTIGINFHWERKENQRFQGALKLIAENGGITAINIIMVEDYLTSVISSEMSATASLELLKAHAVISRSWLLKPLERVQQELHPFGKTNAPAKPSATESGDEKIVWFERDAHTHFDVCADDHCQRYQGITRASTEMVKQAIAATRGQVLMADGDICDARFSKCCGGAFEEFQYCWDDTKYPYLQKQRDLRIADPKAGGLSLETTRPDSDLPDLTQEAEADRWIRTSPAAFCNTTDKQILSQVLNNYDQETTDFYRWKVEYTQEELSALILKRSGIDYGQIVDLIPVARGTSGRLWKLKIVGTKRTLTIGKELEIRRTLSPSHLYSSAFVVDKEGTLPAEAGAPEDVTEVPARFILTGAGWGHGVGLCQIGAAVMGEQGYKYDAILHHYFIGASIDKLYE